MSSAYHFTVKSVTIVICPMTRNASIFYLTNFTKHFVTNRYKGVETNSNVHTPKIYSFQGEAYTQTTVNFFIVCFVFSLKQSLTL